MLSAMSINMMEKPKVYLIVFGDLHLLMVGIHSLMDMMMQKMLMVLKVGALEKDFK